MVRFLLPWAFAGFAGWFVPRWVHLKEEWQRGLVAALVGLIIGLLIHFV